MNEPTLDTLKGLNKRLGCKTSAWTYLMGLGLILILVTVSLLTSGLLQAKELRSEYKAPFSGLPLSNILQPSATVNCFSDSAVTTGYYREIGKAEVSLESSGLKSQGAGGGYKISIDGDIAVVTDEVFGQSNRFQVLVREANGVILVRNKEVGIEVITIDPQNGSFVLSDSGVQSFWNRANVWVGHCTP